MATSTFYIRHATGLYVAPENNIPRKDCPLVLMPGPPRHSWLFRFQGNCLVNVENGMLVHPLGGTARNDVVLILHPGGMGEQRLYISLENEHLKHWTGLLVHPLGGTPAPGVKLCFYQGGLGEPRLKFKLDQFGVVHNTKQANVVGYLMNCESDLVVVPRDQMPHNGTELMFEQHRGEQRALFRFDDFGCLQHVASHLYVHPLGGTARQDVRLVLHQGGNESRLRITLRDGFLVHEDTGLLVHPNQGHAKVGIALLFHPGRTDERRLRFIFIVAPAAPAPTPAPAPALTMPVVVSAQKMSPHAGAIPTNPMLSLPPSSNQRGWIKHVVSGLYVMADGLVAAPGKELVLTHPQYNDSRMIFEWDQGCIRHSASMLYVVPPSGQGAPLVFGHVSPNPSINFYMRDNVLFHQSGMMVQVAGGNATINARLVLSAVDLNDRRHQFTFDIPNFSAATQGPPPPYTF